MSATAMLLHLRRECASSPIAAAALEREICRIRLELANSCGPDDARTVPMDTGVDHAPIAERITVLASHEHPARLIGSLADGATSVVFFPRSGRTAIVPTHRTRLSW